MHALSERHARESHQLFKGTALLETAPVPPSPCAQARGDTPQSDAHVARLAGRRRPAASALPSPSWIQMLNWGRLDKALGGCRGAARLGFYSWLPFTWPFLPSTGPRRPRHFLPGTGTKPVNARPQGDYTQRGQGSVQINTACDTCASEGKIQQLCQLCLPRERL